MKIQTQNLSEEGPKSVMTSEKMILKCGQCSKVFKYDSERKRHEQSHFPQFQCKVCSKNFSFMSALRRHEKQHERTSTVRCNECSKEFRDHNLLKRHAKYAHGESYQCTKCETVFHSEPALRKHMLTHKSESEKRYQCSFVGCAKKFNFAHHLKHHEMTHTNSKQHFCKICGKGFIQSHHLKTHIKSHSADSSLYCTYPECNKKFATEYARKRHTAKCHNKIDSGISSDSSSTCDTTKPKVTKHTTANDDAKSSFPEKIKTENEDSRPMLTSNEERPEDLSVRGTICIKENTTNVSNKSIDEVSDCRLAVGSCIMIDKGENCVCEQITDNVNEDLDFVPIETNNLNVINLSKNELDCKTSQCCGGHCRTNNNEINDDKVEIEYKTDGTVKIKEFFDDIDVSRIHFGYDNDKNVVSDKNKSVMSDKNVINDIRFVPFNSCKAVLGNCIVSGNGTMGEGCLCARMAFDEQVTAEEIEDITPRPNFM